MPKSHFADRVTSAIRAKGNSLCVGIDPRWHLLPNELREKYQNPSLQQAADVIADFCKAVVDVVAPLVGIVKPQSAFFEAFGPPGLEARDKTVSYAKEKGLIVILDSKRNDISSTAEAYATATFAGTFLDDIRVYQIGADAMTINPYLGQDAVEPFLKAAEEVGGGVFILVRTSNPGAGLFQDLICDGKPLYQQVAAEVGKWNRDNLGDCGFGYVGAVVGATSPTELTQIREMLPEVFFLIPGYGAQGGAAADTAGGFREDGMGAIVNSSRGVTAKFTPNDKSWQNAIESAAKSAISELGKLTPMGNLAKNQESQ